MIPFVYYYIMQVMKKLRNTLESLSDREHYLFRVSDFYSVFPEHSYAALKMLLSRAVKDGLLVRVCRGIYLNPRVEYPRGLVLYHTAAKLRAGEFNYLSLETVLSEAGVVSQIPIAWISLMSSGRTYTVECGEFGSIEFIHTKKQPDDIADRLIYDSRCRLWRACVGLALEDMRATGRSMDLIDWGVADELV